MSRVYKVLLDLLTIKMVASFAARPIYWFSLLSLPFLLISIAIILASLLSFAASGTYSLSIAGSGLIFFTLAAFLIIGGAISELVYKTGSFDAADYPLLTAEATIRSATPASLAAGGTEGKKQ